MEAPPPTKTATAFEVFLAFLIQGLTAFGGPSAYLAYFHRAFVQKRGWISEAGFADLVALCHVLPGPASSQVGMAIGLRQAGVAGALAAMAGFTLPGASLMIALAVFLPDITRHIGDGWMHGLMVAVAAVVIQAVAQMARTLAVGPVRAGLAIGACLGLIVATGPLAQICVLLGGGLAGLWLLREPTDAGAGDSDKPGSEAGGSAIALGLFAVLLIGLPVLASVLANPGLGLASVFYRVGSLTFGGDHLILPLLEREAVGRGWLNLDAFLSGYGVMQALPGPLFSFAGFVGAAQGYGPGGAVGGVIALFATFLPGLLLVAGVLPYWERIRTEAWARALSAGVGATVVGVLAATLWDPVLMTAVRRPADWALVAAAYVFLAVAKLPPWLVVIGFAAATAFFLP
jgi:chromate transporter